MHVASSFARVQKCPDYKIGSSAYVLELLESNRSAYAIFWIKSNLDRKRSIRRKYYTEHDMAGKDYPQRARLDTPTDNGEIVTILTMETFRERQVLWK